MTTLIRRIDDLMAEAVRLRNELNHAMRERLARPFWPERRRNQVPHSPDRRSTGR